MQDKQFSRKPQPSNKSSLATFFSDPKNVIIIGVAGIIIIAAIILFFVFKEDKPVNNDLDNSSSSSQTDASSAGSDGGSSNTSSATSSALPTDEDTLKKYKDAQTQNGDVVGWIKVPGFNIDYPVLQSNDNEFYLDRGLDKKPLKHGSIFADASNNFRPSKPMSRNTTLYGHNKDDLKYFSEITLYAKDPSYVNKAPYIHLTTENGDIIYRIFATFYTETTDPNFYYILPEPDDKTFKHFIDEAKARTENIIDCDVSTKDKIITLSTCTYQFKMNNGKPSEDVRFVVMARELREGESVTDTIKPATKNPSPKKPNYKK